MTPDQSLILERMLQQDVYLSPYKFALMSYDWGVGDLKAFTGPREWQKKIMLDIEDYLTDATTRKAIGLTLPDFYRHSVASGRGPGKSALVGMLSHWFLSTRIGGSVWVAANGEPQLRTKTFPEIAKWVSRGINREFFDINAMSIQPATWFKKYIESPEGLSKSTSYYYISGQLWSNENPDAFAGAHNGDGEFAILDESSGIPQPIWDVQNGVFTENIVDRFWLTFSNPRSNQGAFFDCFNKNRNLWRTTQIDSRDVEGVSIQTYQNIIDQHGEDSDEARVEVYGQFPKTGEDQFISPTLVDAAVKRPVYDDDEPIVLGIDPARGGLDSTVIIARKGRDMVSLKRYKGEDTMTIVGRVIEAIDEFNPAMTVIDEGGLGYGILDRLVELGYRVRGVNFGWKAKNPVMWGNKRAEIWGAMRDWLKTGKLLDDRQLKEDLVAPHKKPNSSGAIFLEGKKEMKSRGIASPDAADSLAVTFSFPVPVGGTILKTQYFEMWMSKWELPRFDYVLQSYDGAYDEEGNGRKKCACTVWGVFNNNGKRGVMLLDAWTQRIDYPAFRTKMIDDWGETYGHVDLRIGNKGKKADAVLIESSTTGMAIIRDLRAANIPVVPYNPGGSPEITRAHNVASVLEGGDIYITESKKTPGKYVTWAREFLYQLETFPDLENSDYVRTFTQAMMHIRDSGLVEMAFAEDDVDPEFDYHAEKKRVMENPYAC